MLNRSRVRLMAVTATAALLLAAAASARAAQEGVSIVDFDFVPSRAEINVGDTVVWTNNGQAPHTVQFTGQEPSPILETGQTYSRTFDEAGTFEYICSIHPQMTASVVVAGGGGGETEAPTEEPTEEPTDGEASPEASQPPTDTLLDTGDGRGGGVPLATLLLVLTALGLVGLRVSRRRAADR